MQAPFSQAAGSRRVRSTIPRWLFAILVLFQALCAIFFLLDIFASLIGPPLGPITWQIHELIEIGAACGLLIGLGLGTLVFRSVMRRNARVERALQAASGAFGELLSERFETWGLTPAERDVALFSIKGMSLQEIADLRGTSTGTVKAQTNAIYRKSGVNGRSQLLSLFVEDLLSDELMCEPAVTPQTKPPSC